MKSKLQPAPVHLGLNLSQKTHKEIKQNLDEIYEATGVRIPCTAFLKGMIDMYWKPYMARTAQVMATLNSPTTPVPPGAARFLKPYSRSKNENT